ncbi:MAG TPA: gluconate:H+ symporter [Cyclobacteriaceae bacterium]|jgi:Gnt-I system high-affinity gluconate transporter|nr:gluconate:H+ symporter [Cyclobacteriaceae bacterium]
MTFIIILFCIIALIILITWARVNPFLAFLMVSTAAGLLLGIPYSTVMKSVTKGIGDTLGSLVIVIVLGAMLGKLVAESGAAKKIALVFQNLFGAKYLVWAMTLTGFVVGIPLYYNVGFVLLVPIIFSVAYYNKLPLVYVGLPMLASLSVMHGFLPPHPSPMALVIQFNADLTTTFFYGLCIAFPAIVIAGPLFSRTLKDIKSDERKINLTDSLPNEKLPGIVNSLISSLLPVLIISITALATRIFGDNSLVKEVLVFLGDPNVVMGLTLIIATYSLGISSGKRLSEVMQIYSDAVKEIAMILLIIGSAGILKQIFIDSGVSKEIADVLAGWHLPPLLLAWVVTAILRLCLGSATIAGLTAAGIIYPVTMQTNVDPNLMVLSIGAGSLFFSHVNDTAFWMFKEYFGLSMKDTFRTWTIMETIVSVIGLGGVLVISQCLS